MSNDFITEAEKHANKPGDIGKGMKIGIIIAVAVLVGIFLYGGVWIWGLCRLYVGPEEMLVLTRKLGGKENPDPDENIVVEKGIKGIERDVLGEGRHFISPLKYQRDKYATTTIRLGSMGVVMSRSGKQLEEEEFIAGEGEKGILEKVLTPGRYRLNPFAYTIEEVPHIEIQPGFVGCVTQLSKKVKSEETLSGKRQGIWKKVLQPGIYYFNPHAYKVVPVEVGYRQETFQNITFPSSDSFAINVDVSVVWGLHPKDVPDIISKYGNIKDVVEKVIKQQVESICRLEGSKFTAKQLIQGETRQEYQDKFTAALKTKFAEANLAIQIGLVRGIKIPKEISTPLQEGKLAEEEMLTKAEQQITQTEQNKLEELKADVEKGKQEVEAGTAKMVAEIQAKGEKVVADIDAQKNLEVAMVMEEVARIEAERNRVMGKAEAEVERMIQEEQSNLFKLNVEALGSSRAYELYTFAMRLPEGIKLILRYAGEGTFWTDLPDVMKDVKNLSSFKILEGDR